jgi:hypothetical protein
MRRPRTDFTGWTDKQILEHKQAVTQRSVDHCREADNARRRARYAADPQKTLDRHKARIKKNPERRRQTVRDSRHRHPERILFESAQRRAAKSGVLFTITKEWVKKRYKGCCELTGLEFSKHGRISGHVSPFAASLDQIVAGEGYTPGNVQIILWAINRFKGDMPLATMIVIAKALVDRNS